MLMIFGGKGAKVEVCFSDIFYVKVLEGCGDNVLVHLPFYLLFTGGHLWFLRCNKFNKGHFDNNLKAGRCKLGAEREGGSKGWGRKGGRGVAGVCEFHASGLRFPIVIPRWWCRRRLRRT